MPRVGGGEVALADFRGRRVLLVFSDPQCRPCMTLAPALERWARTSDVQVVTISRGHPDINGAKIAEHGLTFPIGLQRHWEISLMYAMFATPIAYLIDERGIVAAPVAQGTEQILRLLADATGGQQAAATSHSRRLTG